MSGAVVLAFLVGMVAAVSRGWVPISDEALMELRVRDVPAHLPLTGVWSRFGWNHPGPAQFYYLALFYWAGLGSSVALLVGTLAMHLLFTLAAWLMASRLDRVTGMLVLVGSLAIVATVDPTDLRSPWNPFVVMVGGMTLLCAAWSFSERARPGALVLLPLGSFLVQAHLVTAPLVLAVGAAALVSAAFKRSVQFPCRFLVAGSGFTALMWAPPLVEQLRGNPGNLTLMLNQPDSGPAVGVKAAVKVTSQALAAVPSMFTRPMELYPLMDTRHWAVPFWFGLLLVVVTVMALRRDLRFARASIIASAAIIGGAVGVAVLRGAAFSYLSLTLFPTALFAIAVCFGAILRTQRVIPTATQMRSLAAVGLLLAAVVGFRQIGAPNPLASHEPTVIHLTESVLRADTPREVDVISWPGMTTAEVATALMLQLEKAGYSVGSSQDGADHQIGDHRAHGATQYVIQVAPPGAKESLVEDGWTVLGVYQPFDKSQLKELERLEHERKRVVDRGGYSTDPKSRYRTLTSDIDGLTNGRVPMMAVGRPQPVG